MLDWAWPGAFLLLPLPWLVRRLPPVAQSSAALWLPFLDQLGQKTDQATASSSNRLGLALALLAWISFIFALARPQWQGEAIEIPLSGRDLMLAVDLSGSMAERDFVIANQRVDRLTAAKIVVSRFIEKRQGDRLGLILFGDQAYLQVPLTYDLHTVQQLLEEAFIKMAGQRTAIGDAIGLAIKRLKDKPGEKVLILMSDGENTAGHLDPVKAARLAADYGLKIYTIGIGSDQSFSPFFVQSALDEQSLRQIAQITGGRYFRARDTAELVKIYDEINRLEPIENEKRYFRPVKEWFYYPLSLSLCLYCLALWMRRI